MVTDLLTHNPGVLALKLKSFSQQGIERLVYSFIKTPKYCHEKRSNPSYSFVRIGKVGCLINDVFASTHFCNSLKNWYWLTKSNRNWNLPELISIDTSHYQLFHYLNVMLIIRLSSKRKLCSLLFSWPYFKSVPKFMYSSQWIHNSFRFPSRTFSLNDF